VALSGTCTHLSENGEALCYHHGAESQAARGPRLASELYWYAVKTFPRHEKQIREHLEYRDIECFLPTYQIARRWKNGCKVQVETPLFPTYLFVEIEFQERFRVLDVPGVLSFVGSRGKPWPLPNLEIQSLRSGSQLHKFEPHAYLTIGQRVRIKAGALTNLTGILVRKGNGLRVVLSLDLIQQGAAVEVDADEIEPAD
jgi:transcription antitermination factor NusG